MAAANLAPAESPVLRIPVNLIDVPMNRLRSLKHAQADAIGCAILADGQYDPITVAAVGERYQLVDGLHRLEGCRLHEVEFIDARIVPDDPTARLRQEVLSAWARADHDVFDTAAQVKAIAELSGFDTSLRVKVAGFEVDAGPKTVDAEACAMMAQTLRWDEKTAETLGIGRRSVFRQLKILRAFDADQVALLRRLGLADELVPLERLSALAPADFRKAMAALEGGAVATIAEALALVAETATASPFAKKSGAFLTFLRAKATPRERADLMRQLNDEYLPDGRPRSKAGAKAS